MMSLTKDQEKNLAACLPRILDAATVQYEDFATGPKIEPKESIEGEQNDQENLPQKTKKDIKRRSASNDDLIERSKAAKAVLSHILLILKAAKSLSDKGVMEKDTLQAMQNAATRAAGLEDVQAYLKSQNMDPPS